MKTFWLYFKIGYNTLLCSIYTIILVLLFSFVTLMKMIGAIIVPHIDVKDRPQWYINFVNIADDAINILAEK